MITKASIYVLKQDGKGHELLREVLPDAPYVNGDPERYAHVLAAEWLSEHYPLKWCYRYADLVDGVTTKMDGVYTSPYDGKSIDGVIDMSLIKNDGFRGQFQWIRFGAGTRVPAYITTEDPERDARNAIAEEKRRAKKQAKREALVSKLEKLPPIFIHEALKDEYAAYVKMNSQDGYSMGVVDFAERWARLLQVEYQALFKRFEDESHETVEAYLERGGEAAVMFMLGAEQALMDKYADAYSHKADVDGITGFMYGCAVQALAKFWVHGEALRKWHNHEWGQEGAGVVNPAVLTIGGAQ